jgi:hypothetical protein
MEIPTLGRLVRIDLRTVWVNEATHFTPWLAREENIALLGDAIRIELAVEAQEKEVGPFRADILCKDTANDSWVLIENQIERTDHTHLGQLITYAAGLDTVTIVWISERFTEEHRAALDWLNEVTDERISFFGLEIELWRIGESPIAPKFNIICKPNTWTKSLTGSVVRGAGQRTPAKQLQLEYWTAFRAYLEETGSIIKPARPGPQHWLNIALGRTGFRLAAVASFYDSVSESYKGHEIRAEFVLEGPESKENFALLEAQKGDLEQAMGEAFTWYNPPEKKMCRLYIRRPANLEDRSDWQAQHAWLKEKLEKLHNVFSSRVKALVLSDRSEETHTAPVV